jgi:hypothetical protein
MLSIWKALRCSLFVCGAFSLVAMGFAAPQARFEPQSSSLLEANLLKANLGAALVEPAATSPQVGQSTRKRGPGRNKGKEGTNGGGAHGLSQAGDGIIYDANLGVYWLADANLADDPKIRKELGAGKLTISPNGAMDYDNAVKWVGLMNSYNKGQGYLGHNNWQLPVTPARDTSCLSINQGNFGADCTGSALGNLYKVGLGRTFPDSVVSDFTNKVGPFENLQPALYWTMDKNPGGEATYSFLTNIVAGNTTLYNYMHVLATKDGAIGTAPSGSGVVAYTSGPATGKAVYDATPGKNRTWVLDANLPRSDNFGITGTTTIASKVPKKPTITVPKIDADGAMLYATAHDANQWIDAMKSSSYAGAKDWKLPSVQDLQDLFTDLKLKPGDSRLVFTGKVGLFQNLQPFFYWACQRNQNGNNQSPCDPSLSPAANKKGDAMAWSFNFDNGFEGTSETTKTFYVMVYYAPTAPPKLTPPLKCHTPQTCCAQAGGTWSGGRCN